MPRSTCLAIDAAAIRRSGTVHTLSALFREVLAGELDVTALVALQDECAGRA